MRPDRTTGTGTNQEDVRRHNLGTLLRHVHGSSRGLSRAELTSRMGLNRSTIAGLVAQLESLAITEQGPSQAARGAGRPSAVVGISPRGPYVVAVDLGVDRMVVARVGLGGAVQQRARAPIRGDQDPPAVAESVARLARTVLEDAPRGAPLVGIGISIPGLVRRSDGLVRLAPNLGWSDVDFAPYVLAALGVDCPVSLANDADLGALAEHQRGAGVGVDDLIYISGNVGVGAGILAGGVGLEGAGGYSGEIGHLRFNPTGTMCHCGNRGCWETEVGAFAIAAAIGCPIEQVATLGEVLDGYSDPTPELRLIGDHLGEGLGSVVNAFNPQMIVLGGYLRSLYPLVSAEVDHALAQRALPAPYASVQLSLPGLGADSVLLGAAEIAFEPLLVDPEGGRSHALHHAAGS